MARNPSNPSNLDYGLYESTAGVGGSRRTRRPSGGTQSRSTRIPESQSPAPDASNLPSQMSVEDFVSRPGREHLTPLHPECEGRATWFDLSHNGITKSINRMLNGLIQRPYGTYASMPLEDQTMWFRQFAQEFTWDSDITATVRREFDAKAAVMYSRKINEWKAKWKANGVPREMLTNPDLWNGFIGYWKQEETIAASETHSTNRRSDRNGKGIATHNLGATSKKTRAKQLFLQDGVPPTNLRLLADTHTSRKDGQIQDLVTREIIDTVTKLGEDYLLSQPFVEGTPPCTEVPPEMENNFVYEATKKTKGRVYGLPHDSGSPSTTSRFYGDSSLRAELAEKSTEIDELKMKIQTIEDHQEAERERSIARDARIEAEREAEKERIQAMEAKMEAFMASFRSQN